MGINGHRHHRRYDIENNCGEDEHVEKGCGCCHKHDDVDEDGCRCEHKGRRPRGIFNRRRARRTDED